MSDKVSTIVKVITSDYVETNNKLVLLKSNKLYSMF